jgi:sugar lactone lactonase YvrE
MKAFLILLCCALSNFAALKIETVAGTGKPGFSGDGGPALRAELNNPYGLVVGPEGALFVCDMGNHRIRKIDKSGIITTVAGSGGKGWSGDGGPATAAALNEPYEVRFDRAGNMFFVEMRNAVVRRVDGKTGIISTIAGNGHAGFQGDGGAATNAMLNQPHSIQFVRDELWICDIGNHRIRAVNLKSGIIGTVGGTGERLPTRSGELLSGNPLNGPRALDVDAAGDIWLALREGNMIYRIKDATHRITRAAGSGKSGFINGAAPEAAMAGPKGITVNRNNWVIWADTESHTVRFLDPQKRTVETLAGTGKPGDGKDGDALACALARPHGVHVGPNNVLWIGDSENHRIRKIVLP